MKDTDHGHERAVVSPINATTGDGNGAATALAGACIAWQSAPIAEGDRPMLSIELVKAANTLKDVSKKVAQFLSDAVIDLVD